jgi:hypothetical protein
LIGGARRRRAVAFLEEMKGKNEPSSGWMAFLLTSNFSYDIKF